MTPTTSSAVEVDLPLVHRVHATLRGLSSDRPAEHLLAFVALARRDPDRAAAVLAVIAAVVNAAGTPELHQLIDAVAEKPGPLDLTLVARAGHRTYEQFRARGETLYVPPWASSAERVYSRISARARRG